MKKSFLISSVVFLTMSSIAYAGTSKDLKLSAGAIELTGAAPAGAQISALMVYIPDPSANADMKACFFKEDQYSPNGANIMVAIDAVPNAQGSYALKMPLRGDRKNCKYIFNQIYLSFKTASVFENLLLNSDAKVAEQNAYEEELQIGKTVFQDFEDQKVIYCDFESSLGICHINGGLTEIGYHVSTSEHVIQFDIKDESERPTPEE